MIISLTGDDKVKINDFIADYKSKFNKDDIYIVDKSFDQSISTLIDSNGLFSQEKLIVVANAKSHPEFELDDFLENLNKSTEVTVIMDLSNLNANLKIFKNIKKNSKHFSFVQPRDYTLFNLCDALFLKKDRREALSIINSIDDIDDKFLLILATTQSSLRNYVSLKYQNKSSKTIHPFMAKKISSYKLTFNEVKAWYEKLVELDLKSKSQKVDKKALLIDLVLYFF